MSDLGLAKKKFVQPIKTSKLQTWSCGCVNTHSTPDFLIGFWNRNHHTPKPWDAEARSRYPSNPMDEFQPPVANLGHGVNQDPGQASGQSVSLLGISFNSDSGK